MLMFYLILTLFFALVLGVLYLVPWGLGKLVGIFLPVAAHIGKLTGVALLLAGLAIVVENDGQPPFPQYADLGKALADLSRGTFKIMMSHDPTHWRRAILPETDVRLTLSGHTHALQFRLWGFSPSSLAFKEWGGLYSVGDGPSRRSLFVSTGSGGNIPFRFGAWPEVDIITLRRSTR